MLKQVFLVLFVSLALAGCEKLTAASGDSAAARPAPSQAGSKYVGTWVSLDGRCEMTISNDGPLYFITGREAEFPICSDYHRGDKSVGKLQPDGTLAVGGPMPGLLDVNYLPSSDHLIWIGLEYRRGSMQ